MSRTVLDVFGRLTAAVVAVGTATCAGAAVIDFEDLTPTSPYAATNYTGPGGGWYWSGPDPNGTEEPDPWGRPQPVKVGTFASGGADFGNRHNLNGGSWSGFAYSSTTDTTTGGHTNQYSAYAGSGAQDSANYGVAYGYLDLGTTLFGNPPFDPSDPTHLQQLPWFEIPDGAVIQDAYVTNTTYAALSMVTGDSFAKKFGGANGNDPDWFKLNAYGTDAAGIPLSSTVELYLADYRFADNGQDYILGDWTLLDLSPLAGATRLYFNLSSSDAGEWGMNTPSYFALDNVRFAMVPEPSTLATLFSGCLFLCGLAILWSRRVR